MFFSFSIATGNKYLRWHSSTLRITYNSFCDEENLAFIVIDECLTVLLLDERNNVDQIINKERSLETASFINIRKCHMGPFFINIFYDVV